MKNKKERDKIESIIYAYAVNHCSALEGDWAERRRVRNLALDDLQELIQNKLKAQEERIEKRWTKLAEGMVDLALEAQSKRIIERIDKNDIVYCTIHSSNNAYDTCDICSLGKKLKDAFKEIIKPKTKG